MVVSTAVPARPSIRLRAAQPADCGRIARLDCAFFPYAGLTSQQVDYYRRKEPSLVLVASDGGEIAGFLIGSLTRRGRTALHVVSMGVVSACRRRGLGKRLLRLASRRARAAGATRARLEVWTRNRRAIRLYESLEFETLRTHRDYYEPGRDAYVMQKHL
jgi:ribosomal-protein-alanine N-acetyltransferase